MKVTNKDKFRLISNFLGVCILSITISVQAYWGNLSVYALSYVRDRAGSDEGVRTPWIISIVYIGWSITMALSGYVADFIGQKWTIILGAFLLQVGVLSGYFLIQSSLVAFNITFGILSGLGSGLVNCTGLQSVLFYRPKYPGVLTGLITTCTSAGGVLFNQIITLYVNPNNRTPNLHKGRENYFTQPEVLKRVPTVFLVIGAFNLCCHVIGVLLLKPKERKGDNQAECVISGKNEAEEEKPTALIYEKRERETIEGSNDVAAAQRRDNDKYAMNELKPKEVLKTKLFYVLWFSLGVSDIAALVHFNYYKTYGQVWIHDDHFLTALASSMSLAMAIVRLLWGLSTEKCGAKYSDICLLSGLSVTLSLWYFAPLPGRWFYLVWTIVLASYAAGVYIVFPVTTLRLFGSDHFSHNYGMVMTSRLVMNLVAPLVLETIVTGYGYFYLFFGVGCCNVIGMLLIIYFLPRI